MNEALEDALSQCEKLLEHLREGLPITQHKALSGYGILRLAARVHNLRQLGHQIERRMVEVPTRGGKVARVAEYFMG